MTSKAYHPTHPPWTDMITECITTTPDGTKNGVSRPAIKKFVDSKYHLSMNAAATSQLNRAITHGTVSGNFVLPKGPSGKVKLAPKRVSEIAKEVNIDPGDSESPLDSSTPQNEKPKRPTATKATGRPVSTKAKHRPSFVEEHPSKTKKYTSMAKKARLTPIPGRQVPARKASTRRGSVKKMLTRSATVGRTRAATRAATLAKRTSK